MKIFCDIHHFDLYYSFQLLANRFGWELYRPIGLDWVKEGYWAIGTDPEFHEALLSEEDGKCAEILNRYDTLQGKNWAVFSLHLPRIGRIKRDGDAFLIEDKSKGVDQLGISFKVFKETKFDIIISTIPTHFYLYEELIKKYQPQAKHILQLSGIQLLPPEGVKNLLHTSLRNYLGINQLSYHQEFDTKVFKPIQPSGSNSVRSYVHFPESEALWNNVGLDWDFQFVGKTLGPLKKILVKQEDIAKSISDSAFTWHIKPGGESYGHILFNSFAIGRPVVINKQDFIGHAGEKLLTDWTYIDASLPPDLIRKQLLYAMKNYPLVCGVVQHRFKQVVDFDSEATKVRRFMENLI